jgi:uncharacterized protein (DUF2225 family)
VGRVSFFSNKPVKCPSCKNTFRREVLRTGRGRLIAGSLMEDLRRQYKPSKEYGLINPLIYNIITCPNCLYSAMADDYLMIKEEIGDKIFKATGRRKKYCEMMFGELDFSLERDLILGAASFFLALSSYSHFPASFAPTTKKAICAIRCSWLVSDLDKEIPGKGYDQIYLYLRYITWKLYEKAIKSAETGNETFDNVKKLGPDIDTDYGYDGALYLMAFLGLEQVDYLPPMEKYEKYKYYRTSLAKVFGFGKTSKEKPSPLLDTAKDLHRHIGETIKNFAGSAESFQ